MSDQHFFADVNLPFHVWVRERSEGGHRWVLRDATQIQASNRHPEREAAPRGIAGAGSAD